MIDKQNTFDPGLGGQVYVTGSARAPPRPTTQKDIGGVATLHTPPHRPGWGSDTGRHKWTRWQVTNKTAREAAQYGWTANDPSL